MSKPLLSLCIPTNGVVELVFPVLESIFSQDVSEDLFEVVVTDNGSHAEFFEKMTAFCQDHSNVIYEKTQALPFLNEIEAYKRANGTFIKFINHRTLLKPGALMEFINFVQNNQATKPIIYFSNGVLDLAKETHFYGCFEDYVTSLSYWSSWSTGMAFWKSDFDKIPDTMVFNELFPHTTILFNERDRKEYIIDNRELLYEVPVDQTKKGRYDLFYAFAVEYPGILCDLMRDGSINLAAFLKLKEDALYFVSLLYLDYVIRKIPCSYDLSGFEKAISVYYSKKQVLKKCKKIRLYALKSRLLGQ